MSIVTDSDSRLMETCSLIAGGFVTEGSQCVVVVESKGSPPQMFSIISKTPHQTSEKLFSDVAMSLKTVPDNICVCVFGICGGFEGKDFKPKPSSLNETQV